MSIFNKNGIREIDFLLEEEALKQTRNMWKDYLPTIPPYPASRFQGKGIVMCGGGVTYFTCAWISINNLRYLGCNLPIEFWYLGNELSAGIIEQLAAYDVECKNFFDYGNTRLSGVTLKPLAIKLSQFKEVLFLDADNHTLRDPSFLFQTTEYRSTGAIFWPDYWKTAKDNPIWEIIECEEYDEQEQESGQIIVNKEKYWKEINLALFFNEKSEIFHKLLLGDKDTFRFAWHALNSDFIMVGTETGTCGYIDTVTKKFMGIAMLQYDLEGQPLFLHRNLIKWDITRNGEKNLERIKAFKPDAEKKEYELGYSNHGEHFFVDLNGDIDEKEAGSVIYELEERCLKNLSQLRSEQFYLDFLVHSHLVLQRFWNHDF